MVQVVRHPCLCPKRTLSVHWRSQFRTRNGPRRSVLAFRSWRSPLLRGPLTRTRSIHTFARASARRRRNGRNVKHRMMRFGCGSDGGATRLLWTTKARNRWKAIDKLGTKLVGRVNLSATIQPRLAVVHHRELERHRMQPVHWQSDCEPLPGKRRIHSTFAHRSVV